MQVSEFSKVIDVKELNIMDGKVYYIVWECQVFQPHDDNDRKKSSVDSEFLPAPEYSDSEAVFDTHACRKSSNTYRPI